MGYVPFFSYCLLKAGVYFILAAHLRVRLASFPVFSSLLWLVAAALDSTALDQGLTGAKMEQEAKAVISYDFSIMSQTVLSPAHSCGLAGFLVFISGKPEIQSPVRNVLIFKCWQQTQNFYNILWV